MSLLTAKSIFELSGRSKQVEPQVLAGGGGGEEGESKELHGEAEVDTGITWTRLLPFIPRDKLFIRVFSLIQNGGRVVQHLASILVKSMYFCGLFIFSLSPKRAFSYFRMLVSHPRVES